jgi:hypothetical protein
MNKFAKCFFLFLKILGGIAAFLSGLAAMLFVGILILDTIPILIIPYIIICASAFVAWFAVYVPS